MFRFALVGVAAAALAWPAVAHPPTVVAETIASASRAASVESCGLPALLDGPPSRRSLAGGAALTRWVSRNFVVSEVAVPVSALGPGGSARLDVRASRGVVRHSVRGLVAADRGVLAAVNAGYTDTAAFVADGSFVLAGDNVTVLPSRRSGVLYPRVLGLDDRGLPRFGTLFARGHAKVAGRSLPLAGVNSVSSLADGTVLFDGSLAPGKALELPVPVTTLRISGDFAGPARTGVTTLRLPSRGVLLVSAKPAHAAVLQRASSERASVSWRRSGSLAAASLRAAVQVGAPLVRDGRRETRCDLPASAWASRPRVIVGLRPGPRGSDFVMLTVRAAPLAAFDQYDSGLTLGQMGFLARMRGLATAYAMDGGASTQMLARLGSGLKLVDRAPQLAFSWERPVPGALTLVARPAASASR